MVENHECLHEDMLLGQSRKIERIDAELSYKKEKLEYLKTQNERMESKIDEIKDCMNQILLKSKEGDTELENRLIKIENENDNLKQQIEDMKEEQKEHTNQMFAKIGLICSGVAVVVSVILHFI